MTNQFSQKVSEVLEISRQEAARLYSTSVGPGHLLLGLLKNNNMSIAALFSNKNIQTDNIMSEIEQSMKIKGTNASNIDNKNLTLDERASNVLRLAVLEASLQHAKMVEPEHLMLALLHDKVDNEAKQILSANNICYEDALEFFTHKTTPAKNGLDISDDEFGSQDSQHRTNSSSAKQTATSTDNSSTPVLDRFSTDLTLAAANGKLDKVVGRESEIQRVVEILSRRKKNNPILIGEPGVGKSAIVEGLAQLIAQKHISPIFFDKRIVSINMTSIVAGTKYRGQFEERIQTLLKEIENNPNIIVFIDEIHTIIGAGSAPGSMDAANIMKPALARGKFQCIGATTLDEYRKSIEKDGALERRFQKVTINPTTDDETITILNNIKERYEAFHHVKYSDEAIRACVNLTKRYVNERFFPDKAIDALDEAGAKVHLRNANVPSSITDKEKEIEEAKNKKDEAVNNQNYELAAAFRDRQTQLEDELRVLNNEWMSKDNTERGVVEEEDIADVVSIMSGVPVQRIAESETSKLRNMPSVLKNLVVGQDEAVDKVVKSIQRNRIGLKNPSKPIGVFMFLGPTGVGKTYLTKQLAQCMFGSEKALIRVDMSEYSEKFNTSRLIGAPPGYVGYEEGGQLTEKVRRTPYSIVLLDEIEKAHPSVFNLLLQVFDEGRLTDGNGRLVDFRNTIIIMTSNTGTRQLKDFGHGIGFNASGITADNVDDKGKEYARSIIQKSLGKQFSPEFLNRLDEIIMFDQLDKAALAKIVDIELEKTIKRIGEMGYTVQIADEVKQFVASKGYDVQYGARPLNRAIQTYIEDGICEQLLNDDIHPGVTIRVDKTKDTDKLQFSIVESEQNE